MPNSHKLSLDVSKMRTLAQTPDLFGVTECNQVKMKVKPFKDMMQSRYSFSCMQKKLSMRVVYLKNATAIPLRLEKT